jgi:anthranilate phosphoribosyltransferase
MAATLELMGTHALLLRGTEGEAVADPRRVPRMQGFISGRPVELQEAQSGSLTALPELPKEIDEHSTATYIRQVMAGDRPVPAPIAQQVVHILRLVEQV